MKKTLILVMLLCVMFPASIVLAAPVQVGDTVTFLPGVGPTGGGVFNIYNNNQHVTFQSFCLERNEYISIGGTYTVAGISDSAMMGGISGGTGGADPLSGKTAWLYYNFTLGKLNGYSGTLSQQGLLQNAIWMFEGELLPGNVGYDLNNTYYKLAREQGWDDNFIGHVRVLNLVGAKGGAQDQLIVTPEPISLILLGFGLLGVVGGRKTIK